MLAKYFLSWRLSELLSQWKIIRASISSAFWRIWNHKNNVIFNNQPPSGAWILHQRSRWTGPRWVEGCLLNCYFFGLLPCLILFLSLYYVLVCSPPCFLLSCILITRCKRLGYSIRRSLYQYNSIFAQIFSPWPTVLIPQLQQQLVTSPLASTALLSPLFRFVTYNFISYR